MNIINQQIRDLVQAVESVPECTPEADVLLKELVAQLTVRCSHPDVVARYQEYRAGGGVIEAIPLSADGFAVSYDVLTEEEAFFASWRRYGIVVSKGVIRSAQCATSIARINQLMLAISEGRCDLSRPETWTDMPLDEAGVPVLSRGFFEIYHDRFLAAIRQAVRVYLHYVLIWGRTDLWTTFDRVGIKLPGHEESRALPLHVDQNPNVHPQFRTVQGVLALSDCPAERGTFIGVPGSKSVFSQYARMAKNQGEYVELDLVDAVTEQLQTHAQKFPLRAGDLISWDSRTTHANSQNTSDDTRVVAYIAAGPAREEESSAVEAREEALKSGLGSNVRDALMHASKRPRYTNPGIIAQARDAEQLTFLGRLLYGKESYSEIKPATAA